MKATLKGGRAIWRLIASLALFASIPAHAVPTAPTNLSATAVSATQINLSWVDTSTDETSFRIERKTGAAGTYAQIATVGANMTTFANTGRSSGTTYFYRVRASNASGNSAYSNEASATTPPPDTTPPTAPSTLGATAVDATQINLAWSAATDNVAVTDYFVERCTGASCTNFVQIIQIGATTLADTGVAGGTTYRYRVRATDAASNFGPYSPIASASTPAVDTTPPTAPSTLSATAVDATQINLAWSAATDNVAVTDYFVERCTGASCTNFVQIIQIDATTLADTGVVAGTTYRYRVRATDAASNVGPDSPIASATAPTTADLTPPTAPAGLTATTQSATQINLAWTASTDNVGVAGYRVERCVGAACTNFVEVAAPTTTSLSDQGLTTGTTYNYRVRASDVAGNFSGYSNLASAATANAQAQAYYVVPDHLNTPRLVANQQGATVWKWDQSEPFGSTPPNDNPSGLGAFEFPLRFPGQFFDRETFTHYNYYRDYDPAIGAYKQSDIIGLRGGLNTYVYVLNNPLTFIDSLGLLDDLPVSRPPSFFALTTFEALTRETTLDQAVGRGNEFRYVTALPFAVADAFYLGAIVGPAGLEVGGAACRVARETLPKVADACRYPILAAALGMSICGASAGDVAGRSMGSAREYARTRETLERIREASERAGRISAGQIGR